MVYFLALIFSLQAQALPQEVFVNFDREESDLTLSPAAIDPTGIDLSFNLTFANQSQGDLTLNSLDILMNERPISEFTLKNSRITLRRLDSHTIRLKDLRFSRTDNPKSFTFILHATGRPGQEFTQTSKIAIH